MVLRSGRDVASTTINRGTFFLQNDISMMNIEQPDSVPQTFEEAWNHPDPILRKKWRAAIMKEFNSMKKRKVWRKIKRNKIPSGRRCVKCKWLFKEKRNGVFRARLVACGYSQVAGIDFSENFAPVVNDITYRILLIILIVLRLEGKLIDVETAFLYGNLEEEIYMDCPEGMITDGDECLLLLQSIYGLVQAARQWWKKLVTILKKIGFVPSLADPCLLTKQKNDKFVYIGLYVDDCICIGHKEMIDETEKLLKENDLNLKVEEELVDYLSCEINFNDDKTKAWLGQPHLIKNLMTTFGEEVKDLQEYKSPGTPGVGITRNVENQKIEEEEAKKYRSGVGMLLYLVKHSRPDIANAVRELSKVMDEPTLAALKELKRVIKYVLDTKNYGLRIEPRQYEDRWELIMFSDSDYGGDKDTRISVGGFVLYFLGVPISWKSKGQKSVTLSSAEAEYVAMSEAVKEIRFAYQILVSMGFDVTLPIIVRVDNVGAIYMTENKTTSTRTKHVDIRYHFVREFIEDGFIKVVFVRSEDNNADIFTKNVSSDKFETHQSKMIKKND